MTKNEKGSDEKREAGGESSPSQEPQITAKETAAARGKVKTRRTLRKAKGRAQATSATPERRPARAKARRPHATSSGVRRRAVPAEARLPVPVAKVRRRRRTADGNSVFDALYRLAAALGYRLELRALGGKQRAR